MRPKQFLFRFFVCIFTSIISIAGFAQNDELQTIPSQPKPSFKHSIGVDFYPFYYNLKFQGEKQYDMDPLNQINPVQLIEPKLWNLYYEYSFSKKDNDRVRNKLRIGLLGFYDREEDRIVDNMWIPQGFPYAGYMIRHSVIGGSVGVGRERLLYNFFGVYCGLDFMYSAYTTIVNRMRYYHHQVIPTSPNVFHLLHYNQKFVEHNFAIAPQLGILFQISNQLSIRVGGKFVFSHSYRTMNDNSFYELPDGSIFSSSDPIIVIPHRADFFSYTYPSKTKLTINPQITLNYAF
jgi:hypothetical protein